ncbi:dihydroneopterin aldolase [Helicobacter cetorum]|uniref:dihydroneopterin aldolase n=1 Tax=Helicobacter cetorum TaxID=138563 RepID=UPI000CF15223|nr:dihydroneopterin aldolase [Helicobacter cetorum]
MKIFISCQSLLRQKALESYLNVYQSSLKDCDFVLTDKFIDTNKPLCVVEKYLREPLSQRSVEEDIKRFYRLFLQENKQLFHKESEKERQIRELLEEYTKKLCQIIKNPL